MTATWLLSKGSPTMPASASSDGKAVMFQPGTNLFVQPGIKVLPKHTVLL